MDQMTQDRRGLFGGLRVPFDLNMLALAFVAVVGFWLCVEVIEAITTQPNVIARMLDAIMPGGLALGMPSLPPIVWILTSVVFLVFWTFFSAAISRIAA